MAGQNVDRRAIYVAALQQFEELLSAARRTGPASSPLPLFYALSQAGRAIVAAYGEAPRTFGHGLREEQCEDGAVPLLHRAIRRQPSKDGRDTFGAVARATQTGDFDGTVELGALWVANPDSPRLPLEHWRPDWRLALFVDDGFRVPSAVTLREGERVVRVLPFSEPLEATADHGGEVAAGRYPTVPRDATSASQQRKIGELQSWNAFVRWREDQVSYDRVAPKTGFDSARYLLPSLPDQTKLMSPLMLWWVLLFGFSVYARYHPELWVSALDVDNASEAVGIEHLLERALDRVPLLVYDALLGNFYPVPHGLRIE
jgi:hypothetical protein